LTRVKNDTIENNLDALQVQEIKSKFRRSAKTIAIKPVHIDNPFSPLLSLSLQSPTRFFYPKKKTKAGSKENHVFFRSVFLPVIEKP
jgi:hypothetical protein